MLLGFENFMYIRFINHRSPLEIPNCCRCSFRIFSQQQLTDRVASHLYDLSACRQGALAIQIARNFDAKCESIGSVIFLRVDLELASSQSTKTLLCILKIFLRVLRLDAFASTIGGLYVDFIRLLQRFRYIALSYDVNYNIEWMLLWKVHCIWCIMINHVSVCLN